MYTRFESQRIFSVRGENTEENGGGKFSVFSAHGKSTAKGQGSLSYMYAI